MLAGRNKPKKPKGRGASSKPLTLLDKQHAIQALANKEFDSQSELAEHYGITKQAVSVILEQKTKIMDVDPFLAGESVLVCWN